MNRYLAAVAGVLMVPIGARAQSAPLQHQHTAPSLIDGSVHPELIPDSVAYRLYLVAVSTGQNPTAAELQGQRAHVLKIGLTDADQQIFIGIVSDFRSKYDALVSAYNDSAKAAAARNEATDVNLLLTQLDALVQSTRATVGTQLSTQGATKLNSFVLSEKKNMKVTED